jgi:lipoprotein NlpD
MRRPAHLLAGFVLLAAGCVQSGAPVVDKPVADWSVSRQPAPPAAAATAPAKPPPAPAATAAGSRSAPAAATAAAAANAADADWRPDVYVVKRGDTLYSIALDHGQSYRDVATWNGIGDPNVIRIGQELRVRPPQGWSEGGEAEEEVVTQPMAAPPVIEAKALEPPAPPPLKRAPKALKLAYSERALAQVKGVPYQEPVAAAKPAPAPPAASAQATAGGSPAKPSTPAQAVKAEQPNTAAAAPASQVKGWAWPARGPLVHAFNSGANPKGIAIGGEAGQPVLAAGPGKVVYSGSGLRGYGKLVIIKHDETYLSVYAHNRELLVKEGQRVAQGQKIAEMGATDADRVALHFEIRRLGKPVDPLQYLPDAGT